MIEFFFNVTRINKEHILGDAISRNEKNKYLLSNTNYNNNTI